jgi:hypothetical protein
MDDKEIITKTLRDIKLIGLYDEFIKVSKVYISNKKIYTIGGFRFCLDLLFASISQKTQHDLNIRAQKKQLKSIISTYEIQYRKRIENLAQEFLQSNSELLQLFQKNLWRLGKETIEEYLKHKDALTSLISGAFSWRSTEEGHHFWLKKSELLRLGLKFW